MPDFWGFLKAENATFFCQKKCGLQVADFQQPLTSP
jgi:hypothetical protein